MISFRTFAIMTLSATFMAGHLSAQEGNHLLTVSNGTDVAVEFFYFATCGGGEWGKDRLGANETIKPGARKVFSIKGGKDDCCYDLRAKLQNSASRQKLNVDICRESEWVVR
jgi:hypothetical protein